MDECAHHVISLLSGHLGGANEWCRRIALLTGAEPVIATATDLNGIFAVDLFARENGLAVGIRKLSGGGVRKAASRGKKQDFTAKFPGKGNCLLR